MIGQSTQTPQRTRPRRSLRGQVMILFAVGVVVLIGGAALAVDVGFLMAERRQNQAAVDAAALSAAKAVLDNMTDAEVDEAGQMYGSANAGVPEGDVDVEWPIPGSGQHTGDEFVKVTITKDVRKFFLGALYDGVWQVTNTAVAGLDEVDKPYALVALDCPGIAVEGNIEIVIEGQGSAISNCDISNSGTSSIFSVGGSIDAVGTIESNSGWVAPDGINPGENTAPDPLADATPPPPGPQREAPNCLSDSVCVIEPGHYLDVSFTVGPNKTVCMKPGTYYLDGNTTISFESTGSTLTNKIPHSFSSPQCPSDLGTGGVLIYIAPGSTAGIDLGNGKMDISTSYPALDPIPDPLPETGACDPTAAPYPDATCGMVLWIANGSSFTSSGNAVAKFEGVIYAPDSHVTLQGTPGSDGLQVIVGELSLAGNSQFTIEYRQYVQLNRPAVFLVE